MTPEPPDVGEALLDPLPQPPPVPAREQSAPDLEPPAPEPEAVAEPITRSDPPWVPGLEAAVRSVRRSRPRAEAIVAGAAAPAEPPTRRDPPATTAPSLPPAHAAAQEAALAPLAGNAPPVYPPLAARLGQHGRVILRLWVDDAGSVSRVEVVQSSGWPLLDAEALRALRAWRFAPRPPGPPAAPRSFEQAIRFAARGA